MKTEVIPRSVVEKFDNRLDPEFLVLAQGHLLEIEELVGNFTLAELKDIVVELPLESVIGRLVFPGADASKGNKNQRFDNRILDARLKRVSNPYMVAAYIALVCAGLASRMLSEADELARQKLAVLDKLKGYLKLLFNGKMPALENSIKKGAQSSLNALDKQ